jgi:hypothetical protein
VAQVRCGQLQTDLVLSIPRGITWFGKKIAALTRPEQRYARIRDSSKIWKRFPKHDLEVHQPYHNIPRQNSFDEVNSHLPPCKYYPAETCEREDERNDIIIGDLL